MPSLPPQTRRRARRVCRVLCLPVLLLQTLTAQAADSDCPPVGQTAEGLRALQQSTSDGPPVEALALALLPCLASPDPVWRDTLAFETLSAWIRGQRLGPATLRQLLGRLEHLLQTPDEAGFGPPFAALTLAEVARVDRLQPFLDSDERRHLVTLASSFISDWRDYRGYDAAQGWRHGVAHGADLALQLMLNPATDSAAAKPLLQALARQILPPGEHAYRFGEGERLMRPVFQAARRGLLTAPEWQAWFDALLAPVRADQAAGGASSTGLARLHNLKAFLLPLYASLRESPPAPGTDGLLPFVREALRQLG